ncbi:hypothetical protein [Maritalea sp.]|uniref:hypothetical protein n=1 Tax=Maritalea sp. TaxID=2003361 RepID=UPI003EF4D62F
MTCVDNINVPRESYRQRVGSWFLRFTKAIWTGRRQPAQKRQRPIIPNDRMVELSPHLLRDIGFVDPPIERKYK